MKFCKEHPTKRVFSKGLCLECYKKEYQKPLKRTPLKKKPFIIRRVSDKRKKLLASYTALRKAFLSTHKVCEIKGLKCIRKAQEVHHMRGRGKWLLVVEFWKAVCHNCHVEITEHSEKAIEQGHSISRNKKD